MFSYKIKEANEDTNKIIIEKSNVTVDFTIGDMKGEQMALTKYIKEFTANATVKKQLMDNIEEHHPFIKDLTEEQIFTAAMYQDASKAYKQYTDKVAEFKVQLEESEKELATIKSDLDIKENIVLDKEALKSLGINE